MPILAVFIIAIIGGSLFYYMENFGTDSQSSPMPKPVVSSARNWAGYVVATDLEDPQPNVFGVIASWLIPSVKDVGTDTFSAVWIGVGGQFDQTLLQTGTEQDSVNGLATYFAWYELLPNDSITIDTMNISPGDQMQASITLIDSSHNLWSITLEDVTTGEKYQNTFTYNSGKLSAEWIVERPEVDGILSELADFGSVTFTSCQANLNGKTGAIDDFPSSEVIMDAQIRHHQLMQLIDVSNLTSQATEFTVDYLA